MTDSQTKTRDFDALHDKYLAERDKRLRSEGAAQYVEMENPFIGDVDDPYATARIERAPINEDVDVVVVKHSTAACATEGSTARSRSATRCCSRCSSA